MTPLGDVWANHRSTAAWRRSRASEIPESLGRVVTALVSTLVNGDLADQLDRLAAGYTVLSRLLVSTPSAAAVDALRDPTLLATWPLPSPAAESGLALMTAARGEPYDDITADYAALFVGPGPVSAVPYESVHLSEEGLLFEEQTLQVRESYAALGLAAPRLNREPDDHVGLEFEFVGTGCLQALDALHRGDDDRLAQVLRLISLFAHEHLFAWVPNLMRLVTTNARTTFFRGVGTLGAAALTWLGEVEWVGPPQSESPNAQ